MTNKEKAIEIFRLLEENHINLYHDISKEVFKKELNKFLEIADNLDDVHFDAEMLKLFALFKDAHTIYLVDDNYVSKCIRFIKGKYYFCEDGLCEEIVAVNGYDIQQIIKKFEKIIAYEFDSWKNFRIENIMRGIKHLAMIDCENKSGEDIIEYYLKSGIKIEKRISSFKREFPYSYFMEEDNILRINYKLCRNVDNLPMTVFLEDIKSKYKNNPSACIIDVRYNKGGDDRVINPLIQWLKENKIKTFVLMNGATFSSGVWAVIDLKSSVKATIIGTEASQAAYCYGNCRWLNVDGQEFSYCTRYFNRTILETQQTVKEHIVSKVIDYLGPIQPDVYLEPEPKIEKKGEDSQMRLALEIIKKELHTEKTL